MKYMWLFLVIIILNSCTNENNNNNDDGNNSVTPTIAAPTQLSYTLVKVYPHDTTAFIEGLQYIDGFLYESTGNPAPTPNTSKLRKVDYTTGKIIKEISLPGNLFGEGITVLNGKIYQFTWKDGKGFVYNFSDFKKEKEFALNLEGWGLTNNGKELILSDGSSNIYFWDPATLKEIRRISIQDNNGLRNNINELEYINGFIYSNVWQTDQILKIDPVTGNVVGQLDFSELRKSFPELNSPHVDVLNGIAWDSSTNRIFITGKYWPKLFEIKLN